MDQPIVRTNGHGRPKLTPETRAAKKLERLRQAALTARDDFDWLLKNLPRSKNDRESAVKVAGWRLAEAFTAYVLARDEAEFQGKERPA